MKAMLLSWICLCIGFLSKQTEAANVPADVAEQSEDKGQLIQTICRSLCSSTSHCPRTCLNQFMDILPSFDKRSPGFLDGFTFDDFISPYRFDDYLFMRLLGRDMHGRRK